MTNDDGIEEGQARLMPAAQRLREFADISTVVPDRDRSGTSSVMAATAGKTAFGDREVFCVVERPVGP